MDEDRDLIDSANRGLVQIKEKEYIEEVKSYGVSDIIAISIAFRGKDVEIVSNLDKDYNMKIDPNTLNTIKNMLGMDMDISVISKSTGVEQDKIIQIKNES